MTTHDATSTFFVFDYPPDPETFVIELIEEKR